MKNIDEKILICDLWAAGMGKVLVSSADLTESVADGTGRRWGRPSSGQVGGGADRLNHWRADSEQVQEAQAHEENRGQDGMNSEGERNYSEHLQKQGRAVQLLRAVRDADWTRSNIVLSAAVLTIGLVGVCLR